ncbi:MAG: bifunctional serine/threonine-protein kinase/formylglycine-generating enzyme family protein, partial [Verrucomicrobia bacterium]|nr:bifunctional serine/threonine-protein kinase/formylglycine-generating enzyme family protein [Verrucomicrobiota bacterium]
MAELTGQTFAGFEVVAKLGQGGMGAVYKARQPLLDRFVALKVMSQQLSGDPAYVARFIREAASAAKLSHPNMVQVFTAGEQGGVYYIVMEFIEGESLSQRLKRVGVIEPVEAIAITLYVAQALQVAWNKAQLIHRDIKPDNIFLSKDGEVKVGDLGLAKSVGAESTEMTQSGMMMGSPHYMSPEQAHASKETDFRTDIYSLGCTLYQLLTGMTPYQADDALGLILKHVNEPAPDLQAILPSCPQPLVALVNKMMAKDRNARHASYDELIAELWQVSDIIGQQQAAATAVMTPTAEHVAMVKPTVVKAATVVPTVEQTIAVVAPQPKEQGFKLVHAVAGIGAVVFLLAGLWFWSPWKQSRTGVSPVQSSTTGQAGRLSYSDAAALKLLGNVFTNSVGGEMVYIPPGEFMMGSTKEEQEWAIQLGPHDTTSYIEGKEPRKTTIGQGFWFERTEVTVGQWKQFVGATRYRTDAEKNGYADSIPSQKGGQWGRVNGASWKDPHFSKLPQDNHPVCCVSWNDAVSFCEWLTEQERKARRLPAGMIVRLPAEAEWEYACRAGTQAKFWWGESPEDGEGRLNWKRNTMDGGSDLIVPVDSYGVRGRNKFGLADMLGNVWEWCLDSFDPMQAHEKCYQNSAFKSHVLRGGSFNYGPSHDRCAARRSHILLHAACVNGFRVCVGVDVTGSVAPAAPITSNQSPISSVSTAAALKLLGNVFTNSVGAEMVYIPPGEFMMGSTKEEQAWALANGAKEEEVKREGEAPRKAAIKQGLWMGRTEVTVGQWKQFVKETSYVTDGEKKGESYVPQGAGKLWALKKGVSWRDPNFEFEMRDDHAVSCISWNDAMAFCEWLDKREQRAGRLVQGYAVRLPKEAEWEYACRAGRQTKFWWGENKEDGKGRLNWSGKDDEYEFVAPVDSFGLGGRNRFGLADMLGNVCEWCLDGYDATQAHEDLWASNSGVRVLRGGSFFSRLGVVRCAAR